MYKLKQAEVRLCVKETGGIYSVNSVTGPEDAIFLLRDNMSDLDRENVWVINLNTKMKPINYHVVSIGGITDTGVEISNLFKTAILSNAKCIMIAHNHPSGDPSPSMPDMDLTERVVKAGNILGIKLVDHVIVGAGGNYYSFMENNKEMFQ